MSGRLWTWKAVVMYFAMTTVVNLDDMQKKSLMETA